MLKEEKISFSFTSLFVPLTTLKAIHWIVFIGFVVYGNMLFNGFVGDDNAQIVTNRLVHSLANLPKLFQGSTFYLQDVGQTVGIYYRPLLATSYAFLYALFGPNPFFFHVFQLLVHITNCVLLFIIFKKMFSIPVGFFLSLVFLVHPINNESVVYLANLQEELYVFWGLSALLLVQNKKSIILVCLCFLLSLLSKESALIFLPILGIAQLLFGTNKNRSYSRFLWIGLICTLGIYAIVRFSLGNLGFQTQLLYMTEEATFVERLMTIPSILWYYFGMVVYPMHIANAWYWVVKEPNIHSFWLPLVVETGVLAGGIAPFFLLRQQNVMRKTYLFFLIIFVVGISLTLQIIPLYVTVADRWFYVPLIGLLGMLGVVYSVWLQKHAGVRTAIVSLGIVLIVLFSVRDMVRNSDWRDSFTLCQRDAVVNTKSFILEFCLANELYNRRSYAEAQVHAEKAVTLFPKYFFSWFTLGKIYYVQGEKEKAQHSFEKAVSYNNFGYGSQQLALVYVYQKKPQKAKQVITKYLPLMQRSAEMWYALALAEYQLGNKQEAKNAAQRAYQLDGSQATYKLLYRLEQNLPLVY